MFQHKPSGGGDFGKVKDSDQRSEQAPEVNSNLCLKTPKIVEKMEDLIFMVYSDAAFGVRRDMASQGGFVVAAARKDTLNGK